MLEVVSPSSVMKDYVKKAAKYEAAGVKEYWIIDPVEKRVLTFDFAGGGNPGVYPLGGKIEMALYQGDLKLDLDEYKEML